jgi:type II secretory pathway component GspD/PulD (secretin)
MSRLVTMWLAMTAVLAVAAGNAMAGDGPSGQTKSASKTPPSPAHSAGGVLGILTGSKDAPRDKQASPKREAEDSEEPASPTGGPDKRITIQTAGTDIGSALRLVAEQGGLNLVIGPGVEGQVSVYLENVPVETALRAIAINNGYAFIMENGVITVSRPAPVREEKEVAPSTVTRIFTLQWQDAQKIKDALEYALTPYGKMKVLNENSEGGYARTNLSDLSGDINQKNTSNSGTSSSSYGSNQSGTGTGTGNGAGTAATANQIARNARKLLVTDTAENLGNIADLIADLDKMPPQVLIEARIVEMTTDLQRQLGIDWDVNVLGNGPVLNHELPLDWRAGFAPGDQIRYSRTGIPRTATGLSLGTIDFSRFTALVRVHQNDNSIRLLANPRLLVFNNHSASILVGERYPILQANITDQGTLTEAFDTYIPVGIQLEVTPSIMADGQVSMLVHPATSALGDAVVGTTGLTVRRILTREIDTRIVMKDGQTIVLGGLISDRKTRDVNKIPGLGDLPGLDVLFRQESPGSQRVDLLVFLTAHLDKATEITERDRKVYDMYRPHFKQIDRSQDVPLHFEIPTEYETPKPMFGDPPPEAEADEAEQPNTKQTPKTPESAAKVDDGKGPTENSAPAKGGWRYEGSASANGSWRYEEEAQDESPRADGQGFTPRFKEPSSPTAAAKQPPRSSNPPRKSLTAARPEDTP